MIYLVLILCLQHQLEAEFQDFFQEFLNQSQDHYQYKYMLAEQKEKNDAQNVKRVNIKKQVTY